MKTIKGFEDEEIEVSDFGEWVGNDYVDYKFEYKNNQKIMKELFRENQELKKQYKELKTTNNVLTNELTKDTIIKQGYLTTCCGIPIGDIPKLKSQQKEFIEYITSYIELLNNKPDLVELSQKDVLEEILSKYKEIIGE